LLLIAKQLFNGLPINLYEFPLAPKRLADHAVLRKLTAEPVADGLHLLLADALRPPFINGAFDTVVTPWLIDILPTDFMRLATSINHLLSKQGQWINFGSLAFQHQAGTIRYSLEETLSIVTECGFDKPVWREDTIPYMDSPASRHARRESVITFAADKNTDAKRQQRHAALPDWLVTGKEPVPLLESFQVQAASTRIYSFIMGMIDGKCSIKDMAAQMEQQRLMNSQDAEAAIRSFLIKMLDDAQ
jgi:hypothetical protein